VWLESLGRGPARYRQGLTAPPPFHSRPRPPDPLPGGYGDEQCDLCECLGLVSSWLHYNYIQVGAYIPKELNKEVKRSLVDYEGDFSDLVTQLLEEWLEQ